MAYDGIKQFLECSLRYGVSHGFEESKIMMQIVSAKWKKKKKNITKLESCKLVSSKLGISWGGRHFGRMFVIDMHHRLFKGWTKA